MKVLSFQAGFKGNGQVEGFDGFRQRDIQVQAVTVAGTQQQCAGNADGFETGAELGDRFGVAVATPEIDVDEGVVGFAFAADANQGVGVLPALPEDARPEFVLFSRAPLRFLAWFRGGGFEEVPQVTPEDFVQALTERVSRESFRWVEVGYHAAPPCPSSTQFVLEYPVL